MLGRQGTQALVPSPPPQKKTKNSCLLSLQKQTEPPVRTQHGNYQKWLPECAWVPRDQSVKKKMGEGGDVAMATLPFHPEFGKAHKNREHFLKEHRAVPDGGRTPCVRSLLVA